MTNRRLKRRIATALSIAVAATMIPTALPVQYTGITAEAAYKQQVKFKITAEEAELTSKMAGYMYKCMGEKNADSVLLKDEDAALDGKLVKVVFNLETEGSEMGTYELELAYNQTKALPVAFLRAPNFETMVTEHYRNEIPTSQVVNSRYDMPELEDGRKSIKITGAEVNLIYDTGSLATCYFWVPSSSVGTVDFELINYKLTSNTNDEVIKLDSTSKTKFHYDTGKEAVTITFDANGGTIGTDSTIKQEVAKGSKVELSKLETPTYNSRTFLGWNTDKNANSGQTGDNITVNENVTYYAIWSKPALPLDRVTVTMTGEPVYGNKLTAKGETDLSDAGAASYQWYRDGKTIDGATGAEYTLVKEDIGTKIFVRISYAGYEGAKESAQTEVVKKAERPAPTLTADNFEVESEQITVKGIEGALYSINGGEFSNNPVFTGLDASTLYKVSVKYAQTDTHLESESAAFEVTTKKPSPKAESKITAKAVYGTVLADMKPEGKMVYKGEEVKGTFVWAEQNADTIYPTVPTGEPKTYKAVFKPDDQEKYEASVDVEVEVICEAKKITVTAKPVSVDYGKELPAFDFDIKKEDLVGADTKETLGLTLQTDASERPDAGTYTITKKECSNANYDVEVEKAVLNVQKVKPEIRITNVKEVEGKATGAVVTLTPSSEDAKPVIEYQAKETDAWMADIPTTAGIYTVRAYLPEENAGKNLLAVASDAAVKVTYTLEKESSNTPPATDDDPNKGENSGTNTPSGGGSTIIIGGTNTGNASTDTAKPEDDQKDPEKDTPDQNKPQENKPEENNKPSTQNPDHQGGTQNNQQTPSDDKDNKDDKDTTTVKKKKTIKINKKKATLKVGKTLKLKIKNTKRKVTWTSSNPKLAKVNKHGKVTALKKGVVTIKAKVKNGKTYKCKITIIKAKKKSIF